MGWFCLVTDQGGNQETNLVKSSFVDIQKKMSEEAKDHSDKSTYWCRYNLNYGLKSQLLL